MIRTLVLSVTCLASIAAGAQTFPQRPITLLVPNPPGGLVDTSARIVSESLPKVIGQTVVVDNRPGGSGNIAYQAVARSKPDGYTLLASYSAYHVANPSMMANLPWQPKDFSPVALVTVATNVIAVHPGVPAANLAEFLAYLKANPGKLNYASQGNGSLSHIGTEMFKQITGTDMRHVAYKGSGSAIQDVLSGQVQVFITTPPSVMGHVIAGKLKALAIAGRNRHPMMPTVPTTSEAGLKGFELEAWVALFAPAGTPAAVISQLSDATKRALDQPDARQRASGAGIEIRYLGPDALAALVRDEIVFWGKVIKAGNITAD